MRTETLGTVVAGELRLDQQLSLPDKSRVAWRSSRWKTGDPDCATVGSRGKHIAKNTPSMPVDDATRGMNCMNAVDTNVLIYFVDCDEPVKRAKPLNSSTGSSRKTSKPCCYGRLLQEILELPSAMGTRRADWPSGNTGEPRTG